MSDVFIFIFDRIGVAALILIFGYVADQISTPELKQYVIGLAKRRIAFLTDGPDLTWPFRTASATSEGFPETPFFFTSFALANLYYALIFIFVIGAILLRLLRNNQQTIYFVKPRRLPHSRNLNHHYQACLTAHIVINAEMFFGRRSEALCCSPLATHSIASPTVRRFSMDCRVNLRQTALRAFCRQ
jgi:hypothetical protein